MKLKFNRDEQRRPQFAVIEDDGTIVQQFAPNAVIKTHGTKFLKYGPHHGGAVNEMGQPLNPEEFAWEPNFVSFEEVKPGSVDDNTFNKGNVGLSHSKPGHVAVYAQGDLSPHEAEETDEENLITQHAEPIDAIFDGRRGLWFIDTPFSTHPKHLEWAMSEYENLLADINTTGKEEDLSELKDMLASMGVRM